MLRFLHISDVPHSLRNAMLLTDNDVHLTDDKDL